MKEKKPWGKVQKMEHLFKNWEYIGATEKYGKSRHSDMSKPYTGFRVKAHSGSKFNL